MDEGSRQVFWDSELELNAFQRDALRELGSIASCHAVTSLAEMTGLTINQFLLMPSPPSFAFDMMGAMVESAIIAVVQKQESEHFILFKCNFQEEANAIYGYILLFPHQDSLKDILSSLEAVAVKEKVTESERR